MAIIGNKEIEAGELSIRSKKDGDLGSMKINHFITKLSQEILARS